MATCFVTHPSPSTWPSISSETSSKSIFRGSPAALPQLYLPVDHAVGPRDEPLHESPPSSAWARTNYEWLGKDISSNYSTSIIFHPNWTSHQNIILLL